MEGGSTNLALNRGSDVRWYLVRLREVKKKRPGERQETQRWRSRRTEGEEGDQVLATGQQRMGDIRRLDRRERRQVSAGNGCTARLSTLDLKVNVLVQESTDSAGNSSGPSREDPGTRACHQHVKADQHALTRRLESGPSAARWAHDVVARH
ncbi:hypothetical protein VTN02DRAFT_4115 [Thermoascus thermophilus]